MNQLIIIETLVRRVAIELMFVSNDLTRAFDNPNESVEDRANLLHATGDFIRSAGDNLIKMSKALEMENDNESKSTN